MMQDVVTYPHCPGVHHEGLSYVLVVAEEESCHPIDLILLRPGQHLV